MTVAPVHMLTASSLVLEGTLSSPVGIGLWFLDDPGGYGCSLWAQRLGMCNLRGDGKDSDSQGLLLGLTLVLGVSPTGTPNLSLGEYNHAT